MEAVDLVNIALRDIGAKAITAISDTTPTGAIASDIYEHKRDALLRAHPWNFADTFMRLSRLSVTPKFKWDYAYALPSVWLRTLAVYDNENGTGAVPYKQAAIGTAERISNGDFDVSTGWSGTNWSIANGVATHTAGATNALTQSATLTANGVFRVEFEIVSMTDGTLQPGFSGGTGVNGTAVSEAGFYAEEITAHSGGNTAFNLTPDTDFDGVVDNVSVVRLDGDDSSVRAILTDVEDVYLWFTRKVTDVDLMTPGFHHALVYLLGKTFSAGPAASNTLRDLSDKDLRRALSIARSVDGMEDWQERLPEGSWVTSRGAGDLWTRGSLWPSG